MKCAKDNKHSLSKSSKCCIKVCDFAFINRKKQNMLIGDKLYKGTVLHTSHMKLSSERWDYQTPKITIHTEKHQ